MLTEREGPAFEWLIGTCERFVILCCLGIESRSASEIRKVLTEGGIIPDTDILLTFLCSYASDHRAVRQLLIRWIGVGGTVLLAPVILEEVAYHAWISAADFRETQHLLGKLQGVERYRYLRNAFVREFHALSAPAGQWELFIGQYRGNSPGDYTKIREILRAKLHAGMVPDTFDEDLAREITEYMIEQAAAAGGTDPESVDEDTRHKLSRDGRVLASIAAFRKHEATVNTKAAVTILSSSTALHRASVKFKEMFRSDGHVVFSRGSFAYLLSLIPEAQLGVDSLRRALFDFGRSGALQDTERRALRIIKSAGVYDTPWAGRWLLATQLRKSMQDEASRLGISPIQIRDAIKTGEQPETAARVIIDALTQLSEDPKEAERLRAAERRIVQLENQLKEAQESLRKAKS